MAPEAKPPRSCCRHHVFGQHQILPRLALFPGAAQQVGRVVGHDQRYAVVAQPLAAQARERNIGLEQTVGGVSPERDNELGANVFDLADQIRLALRHLLRLRVAVAGRSALQYVRDIDLLALEAHGEQHGVQQLAGAAHERLALPVFVRTRSFADKHPRCRRVADAENRLGAGFMQAAFSAGAHRVLQRLPIRPEVRRRHVPAPLLRGKITGAGAHTVRGMRRSQSGISMAARYCRRRDSSRFMALAYDSRDGGGRAASGMAADDQTDQFSTR